MGDNENYQELQYGSIIFKLLSGDFVLPKTTEQITQEDFLSHGSGMGAYM